MPRILTPGNDRGFVLLDAILCLFIAGVILLTVQGTVSLILKTSAAAIERGAALMEERNRLMGGVDEKQ